MDEGIEGDRPSIDMQRDDIKDIERQVDEAIANAIAPALAFNSVALPSNLPDHVRVYLETKADQDRDAAVEAGFAIPSADDIASGKTPEQRAKEREQGYTLADLVMDDIEDQRREREAWQRERHSFAGAEMTGAEWGALGDDLSRDTPLRQWLIERMMKDGKSREQAEQKANDMADVYHILAKPESQRTEAETAAVERAKSDPDYQRYTGGLSQQKGLLVADEQKRDSFTQTRGGSIETGSDLFASAPDLSSQHKIALAATAPVASPAPLPVAPVTAPPGMAGLDL